MNTISTERLIQITVLTHANSAAVTVQDDWKSALKELLHLRAQHESRDTAALVRALEAGAFFLERVVEHEACGMTKKQHDSVAGHAALLRDHAAAMKGQLGPTT